MLPAAVLAAAVPHLSARPRRLARLHRRQDRPRRRVDRARELRVPVGRRGHRLALFNTLFYTVVASVLKFVLGLWLALLLNKQPAVQGLLPRRRCCCRTSCRRRCRRSPSGGSTTRSSRSSAGRCMKLGLIDHYIDFLGDRGTRALAMIAANVWRGVPFVAITLLAGLQTISPSLLRGGGARRRHAAGSSSATSRCRC